VEHYVSTTSDIPDTSHHKPRAEDVYVWAISHAAEDKKFSNYVFLLLNLIPAYELVKKGIRSGSIEAYNAGRRFLLPFCFALGRTKYAPIIARDMIQFYFRAPPKVREFLCDVFTMFDEGIDGKLEETNKVMKSFIYADTENAVSLGHS
jgi:hypothetical protein